MSNLKDFLNNFKECNVLVVGDVMLDRNVYGVSNRLSPEAPVPIVRYIRENYNLGGAGNVALNISNLSPNGKVHLFGFIGDDNYGRKITEILRQENISNYLEIKRITTLKERIMIQGRGQTQQVLRIDTESEEKKYFKEKDKLLKIANESDIIVISDYAKGTINSDLLNCLNDYKNKIIVDPKPRNHETMSLYKNVFMIKCNNQESIDMTKNLDDDLHNMHGERLRNYFNSNILITKGIDGMELFPLDRTKYPFLFFETKKQENFEPTGAGDTVIAALALSLAKNKSLDSILNGVKLANVAAGITVSHKGVYAPKFKEIKSYLENETPESEFS